MNLSNIFKPLAQSIVDAALPAIKADLTARISAAVSASAKINPVLGIVVMSVVSAAIDGWTIKV